MKSIVVYLMAGLMGLLVVLALERYVFHLNEDFYTLVQLPVLIIIGFIAYGYRERVLFSANVSALIFGVYSLIGGFLSRSDVDVLTFVNMAFSAGIGWLLGGLGGAVKKCTSLQLHDH